MQGDMAAYSYKEQNSTKLRLRNINAEFERLLGALWSDVIRVGVSLAESRPH